MQSKSTFLEFLDAYSSLQIWPPHEKFFRGRFFRREWRLAIDHVLCLSHVFLHVSACLFVEFDLLQSSNYSSNGENQLIDENKNENEVRMQTVLDAKSALRESVLVKSLLVYMILLQATCSVVGMRDDAFLSHD